MACSDNKIEIFKILFDNKREDGQNLQVKDCDVILKPYSVKGNLTCLFCSYILQYCIVVLYHRITCKIKTFSFRDHSSSIAAALSSIIEAKNRGGLLAKAWHRLLISPYVILPYFLNLCFQNKNSNFNKKVK